MGQPQSTEGKHPPTTNNNEEYNGLLQAESVTTERVVQFNLAERFANWSFDVASSVSHKAVLFSIGVAEKAITVEWINGFSKRLFGEKYTFFENSSDSSQARICAAVFEAVDGLREGHPSTTADAWLVYFGKSLAYPLSHL